jgi:hypothetical protein
MWVLLMDPTLGPSSMRKERTLSNRPKNFRYLTIYPAIIIKLFVHLWQSLTTIRSTTRVEWGVGTTNDVGVSVYEPKRRIRHHLPKSPNTNGLDHSLHYHQESMEYIYIYIYIYVIQLKQLAPLFIFGNFLFRNSKWL